MTRLIPSLLTLATILAAPPVLAQTADPTARAIATEKAMTAEERTIITHGILAFPGYPGVVMPADAIPAAGYVPGIPRLGVPALKETDASLGVAYVFGIRKDGATALPSGMVMGATWNPELMRKGGAMIGGEARAKGFNVMLGGGANLMRDPRNGRTFEYLGEDPLLTGILAGAAIAGIQSNNIISTIKHFALNGQETGRSFVDSRISDGAARESDLLAFQIAIERGNPGSVMCAYNKVNGAQSCSSDYLLNQVLKRDWGYKGFVMSDWGGVHGIDAAINGLDQQSGEQLDPAVFFGAKLGALAKTDPAYAARLSDMNRRILWAIYTNGVDKLPLTKTAIDFKTNGDVAEIIAKEGIVLLRNEGGVLPMLATAKKVVVIGGYADTGVLSGGGSSQVNGEGGPAAAIPMGGEGPFAAFAQQHYHRSSPLKAMRARAPNTTFLYRDGRYISAAVMAAKDADVVVVFATQWASEGYDQPDLSLPNGQDALIAAVAAVNPRTVVVLETGGPVLMPWLDKTAAVIAAFYPGARGGPAIASILYGDTNPSGRLPATFPASLDQLPRPKLDGLGVIENDFAGRVGASSGLSANYDIEGSDVGYRWFARTGAKPLFPFGFGMSYTSFAHSGLKLSGASAITARFTVKNSGSKAGADVPQLYLVAVGGVKKQRLVGFDKVALIPGESRTVTMTIDPRLLADWADGWVVKGGTYAFALGSSASDLGPVVNLRLPERRFKP